MFRVVIAPICVLLFLGLSYSSRDLCPQPFQIWSFQK